MRCRRMLGDGVRFSSPGLARTDLEPLEQHALGRRDPPPLPRPQAARQRRGIGAITPTFIRMDVGPARRLRLVRAGEPTPAQGVCPPVPHLVAGRRRMPGRRPGGPRPRGPGDGAVARDHDSTLRRPQPTVRVPPRRRPPDLGGGGRTSGSGRRRACLRRAERHGPRGAPRRGRWRARHARGSRRERSPSAGSGVTSAISSSGMPDALSLRHRLRPLPGFTGDVGASGVA